jgi:hypothetical protein
MPIDDILNDLKDEDYSRDIIEVPEPLVKEDKFVEYKDLRKRVDEADLSINNINIQQIFENVLSEWVDGYLCNQPGSKTTLRSCYGGPGDIPDQIDIDGNNYSPVEILDHVKQRDEIGMSVLKQIEEYRDNSFFGIVKIGIFQNVTESNLDTEAFGCACGQHSKTYRQIIVDVINADPDSIMLQAGLVEAVKNLYGAAEY